MSVDSTTEMIACISSNTVVSYAPSHEMPSDPSEEIVEALFRQSLTSCISSLVQASERHQSARLHQAIHCMLACRGKIVVSGVGKSGIIAKKIASTLTSTGTLAITLHPCDALHGDLGVVSCGDVVIMISNSGSTEELLTILPHLTHRNVKTIAIVGNMASALAERVDVAIDASVEREACPLNLAPTTSTTVALAIGDALAVTLMKFKSISTETFASNHPSGRLGKRLTLQAENLMHATSPSGCVARTARWLDVVKAIGRNGLGAVIVTSDGGTLEGVITDGDIRRAISNHKPSDLHLVAAEDIMTQQPIVVSPATLAIDALKIMENRTSQISILPVVDDSQRCVGILRLHDVVRSGL